MYKLKPEYAKTIVETIGMEFENAVILSVLRSAAPNITAKYFAKDLYTSERANIGREIANEMSAIIGDRGIVIESVLLKTIKLPDGLSRSIEAKLEAEQAAQQMEFVLQKEKKEAERKIIEAEGIKKSQLIISEGLTLMIIQYKSLDAFLKLSNSPNSKVIITNGTAPFLLNP
ncbi:MAG: prohibitin family protein [Bacteroidota bacterium]|nr:prohibitin family protein [Bacteroidota bacterium]